VLGLAMQSLCFMPKADDRAESAAHDCCKTGLTTLPPACCLLSRATEAQAQPPGSITAAVPLTPAGAAPAEEPAEPPPSVARLAARSSHSPPPTVLRI
jgi:hypothetical protein